MITFKPHVLYTFTHFLEAINLNENESHRYYIYNTRFHGPLVQCYINEIQQYFWKEIINRQVAQWHNSMFF